MKKAHNKRSKDGYEREKVECHDCNDGFQR